MSEKSDMSCVYTPTRQRAANSSAQESVDTLLSRLRWIMSDLAQCWNANQITQGLEVIFDPALRSSLARCSYVRGRIKLNMVIAQYPEIVREVAGHELAHLVVISRYGPDCRPHGTQWQELMRSAGLPARCKIILPASATHPCVKLTRQAVVYEHRCPVCQSSWKAGRRITYWRCGNCLDLGLTGELVIERRN